MHPDETQKIYQKFFSVLNHKLTMTEFRGKVEIQDSTGVNTTVTLDGEKGNINLYDTTEPYANISIDGKSGQVTFSTVMGAVGLSLGAGHPSIVVKNDLGEDRIALDGGGADHPSLVVKNDLGEDNIILDGVDSTMLLRNNAGKDSVLLDGNSGQMTLYDAEGHRGFALLSQAPSLSDKPSLGDKTTGIWIGANVSEGRKAGYVNIRDRIGRDWAIIDGRYRTMVLRDGNGIDSIIIDGGQKRIVLPDSSGIWGVTLNGDQKKIVVQNDEGKDTIELDGNTGDIILGNADCAEDFDVLNPEELEPGTVMVIEQENKLRQSTIPYDKKVAGIISGAGENKPGIVLDKRSSQVNRKPVALLGKVYCKVDAQSSPIGVGDLLTTSFTPGHAMKVSDPLKAFGAVIGKALRPFKNGRGLIPILIALQ